MQQTTAAPYPLSPSSHDFPDVTLACETPNGLLAYGGDLSVPRLLRAYEAGIFPWYDATQPILWWSPDPRCVLDPLEFKTSRSLKQSIKQQQWNIRCDSAFSAVVSACANTKRLHQVAGSTWIHNDMLDAYLRLFQAGYCHSIEVFDKNKLVGGLYGVALGSCFFGESMFHTVRDASKAALCALACFCRQHGVRLIDCQVASDHLLRLGAQLMPRDIFRATISQTTQAKSPWTEWPFDWSASTLLSAIN